MNRPQNSLFLSISSRKRRFPPPKTDPGSGVAISKPEFAVAETSSTLVDGNKCRTSESSPAIICPRAFSILLRERDLAKTYDTAPSRHRTRRFPQASKAGVTAERCGAVPVTLRCFTTRCVSLSVHRELRGLNQPFRKNNASVS